MLSKKSQTHKIYIAWLHLYKILEQTKVNYSDIKKNQWIPGVSKMYDLLIEVVAS